MKINSRQIAIMAIFAALYAVGVIVLQYTSFAVFQVRFADAMLPLSMIFGLPSAVGLGLGCLIGNGFGSVSIVDVVLGTVANLVACTLAWYISRVGKGRLTRFLGSMAETACIAVIVGVFDLPLVYNVPIWVSVSGVLAGSLIAINVIGFPVEEAIRRSRIFKKDG